ncbi:hypothetical protein [Roseospira navarrensis]|uniref:Uncharacterized protein n=1 Tax=Roseospira navarrensis TaxID=140058 RepID=A0A7X1ZHY7_9PROT|nr:hypothetical protein [Roseospira navarrensis]MQX38299.1 hypothetical protein [Roseospira navarrensis]
MRTGLLRGIAVAATVAAFSAGPAWAQDLSFMVRNATGVTIDGFYVSHTDTDDWEENLLENAYLASGYEVEVVIADGRRTCMYDILTTFADGDEVDDYGVDLCDLGVYTLE